MKVTTAAEMRLVEEKAAAQGLTSLVLMETAGHALAQAVLRHAASPRPRVLVLAGPGQNGGDGLTAARHLLDSGDLDEPAYAALLDALGERGIFELTTLVGYYRTLALQLRVFRVPLPESD